MARAEGNGGIGARWRAISASRLSLRLTEGNCSGALPSPSGSAPIAPVRSSGSKLASAYSGGCGMPVPIGRGMLKVAAWMVPKGEAMRWSRQRCATPG